MYVHVKDQKLNLHIPLPNGLLLNRPVARLISTSVTHSTEGRIQIDPYFIGIIMEEIRRCHEQFGRFTLVEVDAADGTHVKITI